jgi:hypothetical protein
VNEPRSTTVSHLIELARRAAAPYPNPLAKLATALMDALASPAEPYLIIDNLLQTIAQVIAARVPLERQRAIAAAVETRLTEALSAWELK